MNRLLVVVTRMTAFKGRDGDEFKNIWNRDPNLEAQLWKFGDASRVLLAIHGYIEKYGNENLRARDKIPTICGMLKADITTEVGNDWVDKFAQIGILIHPPAVQSFKSQLIEQIQRGCLEKNPAFVHDCGMTNSVVNKKVVEIADLVRRESLRSTDFDEWWDFFHKHGDPVFTQAWEFVNNLLFAFLPFDIELQIENNKAGCLGSAVELVQHQQFKDPPIPQLRKLLTPLKPPPQVEVNLQKAEKLYFRLVEHAKKVKDKGETLEDFESFRREIFGWPSDAQGNSFLGEQGYHRTFEELRDSLLAILDTLEPASP